MNELKYVKIKGHDFLYFVFFSGVLALLFSITFFRFGDGLSFIESFFSFFLFLFVLLYVRFLVMKTVGIFNALDLNIEDMYFDRYWIHEWNRLSYWFGSKTTDSWVSGITSFAVRKKNDNFKGIPMTIFSIVIYILTLGFVIFPNLWKYKTNKVSHLHLGKRQLFEYGSSLSMLQVMEITDWRYSKVLFSGFFYYFITGVIIKLIFSGSEFALYPWFVFALYWIAFVSIIPIFSSEGYELWSRNSVAWLCAFTIIFWGMLALLVFESLVYVFWVTLISFLLVLLVFFWRRLVG